MYRLLNCTKDTYITNRIINNAFRATDANVGHAGTLDLFKLWDESDISGSTEPFEFSRLLVHFDLDPLRALTGSVLDIGSSNFRCTLRLRDVVGGQPTPSNFTVAVYPVSKSWDEGLGRDVGSFSDLDASNWITASVSNGQTVWSAPGAAASGGLGAPDIDIIGSGNLLDGNGIVNLFKTQTFSTGEEDLEVDVTNIVSATLAGIMPDEGYRISFTDAVESISSSLFVKRFASRHVTNPRLAPKLIVQYDDSYRDNHQNFIFDTSGSLFLFNSVRGVPTNIKSGSAATELTGNGALTLKLISGAVAPPASSSFTASYSVDQFAYGNNAVTGVYVANFALSSFDPGLMREVQSAQSASFTTIWGSNDGTVAFKTGSLVVKMPTADSTIFGLKRYQVSIPNLRVHYTSNEDPRVRVTVFDTLVEDGLFFSKLPVQRVGAVIERMYWRLVDVYSGEVIIPFDTTYDSTRLSTDSKGMFFHFSPADLSVGRVYGFEFLIRENGEDMVFDQQLPSFRVMP